MRIAFQSGEQYTRDGNTEKDTAPYQLNALQDDHRLIWKRNQKLIRAAALSRALLPTTDMYLQKKSLTRLKKKAKKGAKKAIVLSTKNFLNLS